MDLVLGLVSPFPLASLSKLSGVGEGYNECTWRSRVNGGGGKDTMASGDGEIGPSFGKKPGMGRVDEACRLLMLKAAGAKCCETMWDMF